MPKVPQTKTVDLAQLTRAERQVGEIVAFGDVFYCVTAIDEDSGRVVLKRVAMPIDVTEAFATRSGTP